VVGSSSNDEGGTDRGTIYVYKQDQGGADNWGETHKFYGSADSVYLGMNDISGSYIVAGESSGGKVHVYVDAGGGSWSLDTTITTSDTYQDHYPDSVAIDGTTIIVGDEGNTESADPDGGAAFVYEKDFGGVDNWGEVYKLLGTSMSINSDLGASVAVSGDHAFAGATGATTNGLYYYDLNDITLEFTDANFRACVLSNIQTWVNPGATYISFSDAAALIGEINCSSQGITSIAGIEYLTSIEFLRVDSNNVTDISPLSSLTTNLRSINFGNNTSLSDLSPISGLTNLDYVYCNSCNISDISALSGLTGLQAFQAGANNISNLAPLSGLTSLIDIYLVSNSITDISALSGLTALTSLSLGANTISDFSVLSGMTDMISLNLTSTTINDISVVSGMTDMVYLYLNNNSISDISALSGMTNLQRAWLHDNNITNITPLNGLTNLTDTLLDGNSITDISSLNDGTNGGGSGCSPGGGACACTNCFADGNIIDISDNTGLNGINASAQLIQVAVLEDSAGTTVTNNITSNIHDQFTDSNFQQCVDIAVSGDDNIIDGSLVAALTTLDCSSSFINSITGADSLFSMQTLNLSNNNISDLSPIQILNDLTTTNLSSNNISDLSPIGSSNGNVANFNSSNNINLSSNNFSGVESAALTEIHDELEANGATITHNIDWENCSDGLDNDDDGDIDGADVYCQTQTDFYVDYDTGGGTTCRSTSPCSDIDTVFGSHAQFETTATTTALDLNIYVQGTYNTSDGASKFLSPVTANIIIQPWTSTPVIDGSTFNINSENTTLEGFEIKNVKSGFEYAGIIVTGDNSIVRNNYIHDNSIGIAASQSKGAGGNNISIYNNVVTENNYIYAGGRSNIYYCGGIATTATNGTKIFNNTLYNNCPYFGDAGGPNAYIAHGDIAASSSAYAGTAPPANTTIKQNIVYNDLVGTGYTYYLEDGITVNGSSVVGGPLTDQTAADWGTGNNFSEKVTLPFFIDPSDPAYNIKIDCPLIPFNNTKESFFVKLFFPKVYAIGMAVCVEAKTAFALSDAEITNYQLVSLDPATPTTDFVGNRRPSGTGEAGAIETQVATTTGSRRQESPSCGTQQVTLNLPNKLPVSVIGGRPVVNLSWSGTQNVNATTKVTILLNYLDTNPKIGDIRENVKNLKGVFASYVRDEIIKSDELSEEYYEELDNLKLGDLTNCNCSSLQTNAMLRIIDKIRKNASLKGAIDNILVKFTNDLLSLEQTLKESGGSRTSFTDYYRKYFSNIETGGAVKIYRNGRLLHTEENPNTTRYTDRVIPENRSEVIQRYNYELWNVTDCGTEIGESGTAYINPTVREGTEINVTLDLKIKVKEAYDEIIMERLHELIGSNGDNTQAYEGSCDEAKAEFENRRTSANALNYILECYGEDNQQLRHKIENRQTDIISPLMVLLSLNGDHYISASGISTEEVIDRFMEPIIEDLMEEIAIEEDVFKTINELELSESLLAKNNISELSSEEKKLLLKINEEYFGSSHAADIEVNVSNGEGSITVNGHTNIFGETELELGLLSAGTIYDIRIGLENTRFTIPQRATLEINNAEPVNGSYLADIALEFGRFKHGNFDESDDDTIGRDDLFAWINYLQNYPELWNEVNIDGIPGINLLDILTFQQNWGTQTSMEIEENQITLMRLLEMFGLSLSGGFTGESGVDVPAWIDYIGESCG
ncbi:hypothetical protein KKA95_00555, partial [Patescibacteria group bacterium]|nr:hypothetical protein [Patescibacteria group bacterium]